MAKDKMMQLIEQQQYQKMREDLLKRNLRYAKPDWKTTSLPAEQEKAFMEWIAKNKVPFNPKDKYADYDMRGFYDALMKKDPRAAAAVNPATKTMHYPDYWKTPYHESFSAESQWAAKGAPTWQENKLVAPSGEVIFEDKPGK